MIGECSSVSFDSLDSFYEKMGLYQHENEKSACLNEKFCSLIEMVPCCLRSLSCFKNKDIKLMMSGCSRFQAEWDYENGKVTIIIEGKEENENSNETQNSGEKDSDQ